MLRLMIIADDFTGALDTGVQFSKNDIGTMVSLYNELDFSELDEGIQVLVVDTESRHIPAEQAAERVREVTWKGIAAGITYFYKKTDSALRGNIGSELAALMEASGERELMFIPAYPDAYRTTRDGCQFLSGVPINKTSFAQDPIDPVTDCHIPSIINQQVNTRAVPTTKETFSFQGDAEAIYVFDAENNKDLSTIGELLKDNGKLRITAGCAGFANTLLDVLGFETAPKPHRSWINGKMLVICGSINDYSLQQVAQAKNGNFKVINLNSFQKLDPAAWTTDAGRALIDDIVRTMDGSKDVIITTEDKNGDNSRVFADELKLEEESIPYQISRNLGSLVCEVFKETRFATLVIIGGDTAVQVFHSLGLNGVIPRDEISTGVVLSEAVGKSIRINLVTKSGGFGEKDVFVKIKEYIRCLNLTNEQEASEESI